MNTPVQCILLAEIQFILGGGGKELQEFQEFRSSGVSESGSHAVYGGIPLRKAGVGGTVPDESHRRSRRTQRRNGGGNASAGGAKMCRRVKEGVRSCRILSKWRLTGMSEFLSSPLD
jgi:hypothetical protein